MFKKIAPRQSWRIKIRVILGVRFERRKVDKKAIQYSVVAIYWCRPHRLAHRYDFSGTP